MERLAAPLLALRNERLDRIGMARLRSIMDKVSWGLRVVGPAATLRGAWRLLGLAVSRPRHSLVRLRSGPALAYRYPGQFVPILELFGDVIDPEYPFLKAIARPGSVIVDVGAAIGQFALLAGDLPGARVYALEPSRLNVVSLRSNIIRNGAAGRITAHRLALSTDEGKARFETSAHAYMSGLREDGEGELVRVTTLPIALDELGIARVSVLKINVAGHEPAVIEGAMPALAEGRVDVVITLLGLGSLPWYERVARQGYRFFYFHPRNRTLHEVTAFDEDSVLNHRPWPARNIIAVRRGAIADGLLAGLTITNAAAAPQVALGAADVVRKPAATMAAERPRG